MGNIITYTGRLFNVLAPRAADVDIQDIAHALSNSCRWGGHCSVFYSVAQHSVQVSRHVPAADALWALLHDAAEAYLVDVPRPIKRLLPDYQEMEEQIMRAVCECFGLPPVEPLIVKQIDMQLLTTEAHQLGMHPHLWGNALLEAIDTPLNPMPPGQAKQAFLNRFHELTD